MLEYLIISILAGYGIAIALVEKGKDWPIKLWKIRLQLMLKKIHWKLPQMLLCTTCTSFWATLFTDTCLCCLYYFLTGGFYFLWPLSGFVAVGISWTIVEIINVLDKEKNINISIGGDENEIN